MGPPVVGLGVPPGPTSPLPPNPVPTGAWAGGVGEPPTPVLPWLAPVSRSKVDMPLNPAPGAIWFAAVSSAPPPLPMKMS